MECQTYLTKIRQKSFHETNINRIEKRNISQNARRIDYNKVYKKLEVPNVTEFQKLCQYFSHDRKQKDLDRIHLGLSLGSEYIKIFLNTNGALYALIGCLSGINSKRQMQALYCVINLGLGTEEERHHVCKKAGSYLIALLGGDDLAIQGWCCWAFGNLCEGSEKICSFIQSQGFEGALLNAVLSNDPFAIQMGFYALNYYFSMLPSRIKVVCKPQLIKEFVTNILSSSVDEEFIPDFCWCLFIISTEPTICKYLVDYGIVAAALRLLFKMANNNVMGTRIFTSLVRVLTNCVAVNNKVAIEICYNADQFVPVVKFLINSPWLHLQDESMQLIANIVNGAMALPVTGENVLEDSNFKQHIEPILQQVLASRCYSFKPDCQFVQSSS